MDSQVQMEYRFLGNSGIQVSVLSFGNWLTSNDEKNQERLTESVKRCWDYGINFFDTAEIYASGQAETQMGIALKSLNVPRQQLVVSTKLFKVSAFPNGNGLSRKHVIEGLNNSLKRLQLDYVDVVFAHRFDHETPLEETCRAFDWVIKQGKAFYWGTSEWSSEQIMEAYMLCEKYNLIKPIVEQPQYNMLVRERFEVEYRNLFDQYKMGTTIWSPLAGGILTGKYLNGIPEDSRIGTADPFIKQLYDQLFFGEHIREKRIKALNLVNDIAKELGCSLAQLALAWAIKNPNVSTAIFGATKIEQIDDNIKALAVCKKLTPEILERISKSLDTTPPTKLNWKTWTPFKPFR